MSNFIFYILGFISASFVVGSMFVLYGMAKELEKERQRHDR